MIGLCAAGHELTPDNVYTRRHGTGQRRECRICKADAHRRWQAARTGRRYPLAPLLEAAGMTVSAFGRRYGISGSSRSAAGQHGLSPAVADGWAAKAGLNPAEVWPTWIADEFADLSQPCAECGTPFVSTRKGTRYCVEPDCRQSRARAAGRRYTAKRRADAEYRERERAYAAEYRATASECAVEARRRQRRARYLANREAVLARQREYDRTVRAPRRVAA